jgi:hypothetical protein
MAGLSVEKLNLLLPVVLLQGYPMLPSPLMGGDILDTLLLTARCIHSLVTNKVISMKTLIIKSLLTPGRLRRRQRRVNSLCQREVMYPSLEKRGKGRFFQ